MKTLKSYSRKLSAGLLVIAVVLSAAISCSKDDDGYGNNQDGDGNNGGTNTVKIQGMAFSPSVITVTAGTTVKWTNYDNVAHTVTSDDGLFDSGSISTNGTFSQTFDSTGTYDYHCTPHPTMTASVVVN
jgi:plastocyanin